MVLMALKFAGMANIVARRPFSRSGVRFLNDYAVADYGISMPPHLASSAMPRAASSRVVRQ